MAKANSIKFNLLLGIGFVVLLFVMTNGFPPAVFFFVVPLILLSQRKPFLNQLVAFAAISMAAPLSFLWVIRYKFSVFILSILMCILFLCLFCILTNVVSKRIKGVFLVLVPPFIWSVLQIIFMIGPTGSYWVDISMFFPMTAPLIWIIGSTGITFLLILFNSIAAYYVESRDKYVALGGILLGLIFLGLFVYSNFADTKGNSVKIALIQGNFNQNDSWRANNAKGIIFETYRNLSLEASKYHPVIIIWPEYSILDDVTNDKKFQNRLFDLARQTNSNLIVGAIEWQQGYYGKNRLRKDKALFFSQDGELQSYDSVRPIPFEKWVVPGDEIRVIRSDIGNIGISLCYEETQSMISRKMVNDDSVLLVSMANDQKLDETSGFKLIELYTNLRAAENGKYLARATNTGITKIVNPFGKVTSRIEPYKRGILLGEVKLVKNKTLYTKLDNLVFHTWLIILGLLIIWKMKKT